DRQYQPEGDERRKAFHELVQGLKTEVRQLNEMVTDFLSIGRPSKIKRTRFAFTELFEEVERAVKIQLLAKGVTLECAGCAELEISADKEQMRLVILNLLLNAIEAVSANGRIVIDLERRASTGESVISVKDDGPGIPAEDLPNIFEPYFTKRPGGTGLGLALVRRVIEEHGGKIRASNTPGSGARFEITLPAEGRSDGTSIDR
ncbi:MAG TPA: ATP-binding protein, partial [Candidatus Bathyarchaeia archaeon]|nr:ATP-binding protein [Candidatus Bathyarchaeia archaeon]